MARFLWWFAYVGHIRASVLNWDCFTTSYNLLAVYLRYPCQQVFDHVLHTLKFYFSTIHPEGDMNVFIRFHGILFSLSPESSLNLTMVLEKKSEARQSHDPIHRLLLEICQSGRKRWTDQLTEWQYRPWSHSADVATNIKASWHKNVKLLLKVRELHHRKYHRG